MCFYGGNGMALVFHHGLQVHKDALNFQQLALQLGNRLDGDKNKSDKRGGAAVVRGIGGSRFPWCGLPKCPVLLRGSQRHDRQHQWHPQPVFGLLRLSWLLHTVCQGHHGPSGRMKESIVVEWRTWSIGGACWVVCGAVVTSVNSAWSRFGKALFARARSFFSAVCVSRFWGGNSAHWR